mgnify:FL=1
MPIFVIFRYGKINTLGIFRLVNKGEHTACQFTQLQKLVNTSSCLNKEEAVELVVEKLNTECLCQWLWSSKVEQVVVH